MSDLPKKLRIKAGMIDMGERIAWGSETALMEHAATHIEQLEARVKELESENAKIKEALTDRAISIEGINLIKAGE